MTHRGRGIKLLEGNSRKSSWHCIWQGLPRHENISTRNRSKNRQHGLFQKLKLLSIRAHNEWKSNNLWNQRRYLPIIYPVKNRTWRAATRDPAPQLAASWPGTHRALLSIVPDLTPSTSGQQARLSLKDSAGEGGEEGVKHFKFFYKMWLVQADCVQPTNLISIKSILHVS